MICILHYISASRRLKEWDKTIAMLGGPSQCNNQMLAQRDMVQMEKDYYHEEMDALGMGAFHIAILLFFILGNVAIYYKFFA